uniref:Chromo domain-containing protein n=1 Tax=Acrobeloides nanus TaxID=290746 RepID=A0A914E1J6_9BILA
MSRDEDDSKSQTSSIATDEASEEEGEGTYVVREILDHCKKDGVKHYLVAWKGWDNPEDNTWEPEENLWGARDAIKKFWKKKGVDKSIEINEKVEDKEEEDDDGEYRVQKVITHRLYKDLKKQGIIIDSQFKPDQILYRVRWDGYSPDDDTWEPERIMKNVKAFIEYQKKNHLGIYTTGRSKSPSVEHTGKKRAGSPLNKNLNKKSKYDERDKKLFFPPTKDEIRKLQALQAQGTKETDAQRKAREHQLQEGGDVFGHFLSNIDSQKKAIAKKKALEKQRKREAELKAKEQVSDIDPNELFKQYEEEARRQLNEPPPRVKRVTPEEIAAFKEKFKRIREEQKPEQKKKRQARRKAIIAQYPRRHTRSYVKALEESTVDNEDEAIPAPTEERNDAQTENNVMLEIFKTKKKEEIGELEEAVEFSLEVDTKSLKNQTLYSPKLEIAESMEIEPNKELETIPDEKKAIIAELNDAKEPVGVIDEEQLDEATPADVNKSATVVDEEREVEAEIVVECVKQVVLPASEIKIQKEMMEVDAQAQSSDLPLQETSEVVKDEADKTVAILDKEDETAQESENLVASKANLQPVELPLEEKANKMVPVETMIEPDQVMGNEDPPDATHEPLHALVAPEVSNLLKDLANKPEEKRLLSSEVATSSTLLDSMFTSIPGNQEETSSIVEPKSMEVLDAESNSSKLENKPVKELEAEVGLKTSLKQEELVSDASETTKEALPMIFIKSNENEQENIPRKVNQDKIFLESKETTPNVNSETKSEARAPPAISPEEEKNLDRHTKYLSSLSEIIKVVEQMKVSNNKETKNAVIYENLAVCKNIKGIQDPRVRKRCRKALGDFMSDRQKEYLDKV